MKIEVKDQLMTIYLGFFNEDDMELEFKNLFMKLKKYYKYNPKGFYFITLYKDKYYGSIVDLKKESEYIDYFENQIDMKINKIEQIFIYAVQDLFEIPKSILKKSVVLANNSNIYLELKEKLTKRETIYLQEFATIIYKNIENLKLTRLE